MKPEILDAYSKALKAKIAADTITNINVPYSTVRFSSGRFEIELNNSSGYVRKEFHDLKFDKEEKEDIIRFIEGYIRNKYNGDLELAKKAFKEELLKDI